MIFIEYHINITCFHKHGVKHHFYKAHFSFLNLICSIGVFETLFWCVNTFCRQLFTMTIAKKVTLCTKIEHCTYNYYFFCCKHILLWKTWHQGRIKLRGRCYTRQQCLQFLMWETSWKGRPKSTGSVIRNDNHLSRISWNTLSYLFRIAHIILLQVHERV